MKSAIVSPAELQTTLDDIVSQGGVLLASFSLPCPINDTGAEIVLIWRLQ